MVGSVSWWTPGWLLHWLLENEEVDMAAVDHAVGAEAVGVWGGRGRGGV